MPRTNRPRRGRSDGNDDAIDIDIDRALTGRALAGRARIETRHDRTWNVQPISAASASKHYLCPGCGLEIAPGVAHLVTWRADGLMGEADDLAARRHWHPHCWRIR